MCPKDYRTRKDCSKIEWLALFSVIFHNGTRQGCPLSPLLQVRSMEPLAVALRCNADVHGVMVGLEPQKLALYKDNLLMYVSSPTITLPIILKEFDRLGALSNYIGPFLFSAKTQH